MFFAIAVAVLFIYIPNVGEYFPNILMIISFILLSVPILFTVLHIVNYRKTMESLPRLASFYIQIVMMFSVIYFYAVADNEATRIRELKNAQQKGIAPVLSRRSISEIDTSWIKMLAENPDGKNKEAILKKALVGFYDCFHFSLVTSTTLGYGDMAPKTTPLKFMVDLQVLASLFLMAFGVGGFFSHKSNGKHSSAKKALPDFSIDSTKDIDETIELLERHEESCRTLKEHLKNLKDQDAE